MPLAGRATPEATQAYRSRFPEPAAATLGRTGLAISQAGFGSYRIDDRDPAHREALSLALTSGVNLIDTSANYSNGHSEVLIGQVLHQLQQEGKLQRQEVAVVSKAGYIQGQNMAVAQEREQSGNPFPEVVKLSDDLWHCLHPDFLADQLTRSLQRLDLESLDVYLLHNPEYFLKSKGPGATAADRQEYERRLQEAFRYLETQVAAGRIGCYGISSNTFPEAADSPEFTSLERCLQLAGALGADHHFRVIQLPANLYERGFVLERNQSDGRTLIDLARQADLGVLINRPLNAFTGSGMVRLADALPGRPVDPAQLADRLTAVRLDEARLLEAVSPALRSHLSECLIIGELLDANWRRIATREHWQDVLAFHIRPRYETAIHRLSKQPSDELDDLLSAYHQDVQDVLGQLHGHFQAAAHERAAALRAELVPALDEAHRDLPLSQLAVTLLRSVPGVACVLVGMRSRTYVEDVLAGLRQPAVADAEAVWRHLTL